MASRPRARCSKKEWCAPFASERTPTRCAGRTPRAGAQLPAYPRICRHRRLGEPWQNFPAHGCGGGGIRPPEPAHTPASARICAHFPSKISRNLRKNPVNLSIFIEFFGNSISASEAIGSAIIPQSPESARTANAGKYVRRLRRKRSIPTGKGGIEPTEEAGTITPWG